MPGFLMTRMLAVLAISTFMLLGCSRPAPPAPTPTPIVNDGREAALRVLRAVAEVQRQLIMDPSGSVEQYDGLAVGDAHAILVNEILDYRKEGLHYTYVGPSTWQFYKTDTTDAGLPVVWYIECQDRRLDVAVFADGTDALPASAKVMYGEVRGARFDGERWLVFGLWAIDDVPRYCPGS